MAVKNSRIVTKVRSGKCFICDTRAAFKDVETIDGVPTTTWWCKDHAEQDMIDLANSANTNTSKSTTTPKKETTMVAAKNTPAKKKTAPRKPAASPAMATTAKARRKPATKPATDAAPKDAAPKRRRRPVKAEPTTTAKPTARRGKSTTPAAPKEDNTNTTYVLGAEVDGQIVYIAGLVKKDAMITMTLDTKSAIARKTSKSLAGYWTKTAQGANLNPGVLLNPFNEDDDTDYPVMVYTIRNGRRSTRKDDTPVALASVANG